MSKVIMQFILGSIVFVSMTAQSQARIIRINPDNDVERELVPRGQPLNLISWNTHKYDNAKTLRDLQAISRETDFTLLQETLFNDYFSAIFKHLAHFLWLGMESFKESFHTGTGVQTGSRFLVKKQVGMKTRGREPFIFTPKAMLVTYYEIAGSGETLAVANLHALNFVGTPVFRDQLAQLHEVLVKHQGSLIVAGDFNTHLLERFFVLREFANALNLNWVQMPRDSRFLKLDHVLVRGVEVKKAAIRTDVKTSDHYPLSLQFVLPH